MKTNRVVILMALTMFTSYHVWAQQCVPATPTITGVSSSCTYVEQVFTTDPGKSSYNWSVVGGTIRSGAGTNQVSVFLSSASSNATVSVSYAEGTCTSNTTSKNITLTAAPTGIISTSLPPQPPGAVCDGATVPWSVPPGMTNYSWKFTNQSIVPVAVTVVAGSITSNAVSVKLVGNWTGMPPAPVFILVECWFTDPATPGCQTYSSRGVQVVPLPTISVSSPQACVGTAVQLTGALNASMFPQTYSWTMTDLAPVTNQVNYPSTSNTISAAWTTPGQKTINLSVFGCAANPVVVNVNPLPAPTIAASVDPVCVGSPVTYTASGISTFSWSAGPTGGQLPLGQFIDSEVTGSTTSSSITLKWLNGGTANIIVTGADANGCSAPIVSRSVTINGPSISGPSNACAGAPTSFSVPAGLTGVTWTAPGGAIAPSGSSAAITWSSAPATSQISVTATGTVGGCTVSPAQPIKKNVTIRPLPVASSFGASQACLGTLATYAVSPIPGGPTVFQWAVQAPDLIPGPTNAAAAQVQWMQAGNRTLSLTVSDIYGCISLPQVRTISVEVPPAAPTVALTPSPNAEDTGPGNPILVCNPFTVTLTTPIVAGATYNWLRNGSSFQSGTNTITLNNAIGNGAFSVAMTKGACTVTSSAKSVLFFLSTQIQLATSGSTTLCPSSSVQLTATPSNLPIQWLNNGTAVPNPPSGPNTSQYTVSYPASGNYTAQSTYLGCPATSTAIAITSEPTPITISAPTTCLGNGVTSILLTGSGPAGNFNWTKDGVSIATAQRMVTVTTKGTYAASLTTANGCTATSQIVINDVPSAALNTSTNVTACGSYVLSVANPIAGQTYQWYKDGVIVNGQTAAQFTVMSTGTYKVSVANPTTGCSTQSQSIVVTINPSPDATLNASATVVQCGSYTLQVLNQVAGSTYQWTKDGTSIGSNSPQLVISAPTTGQYKVRVTATTGCYADSGPVSVTVNALPTVALNTATPVVQCGGSYNLSIVSPPTGVNYEWTKTNVVVGSNSSTLNIASGTGSYKVKVTTIATGCFFTTSAVDVTINPVPSGTVTASGPLTFCQPGSVTLQATDGTSWQWKLNGGDIPGATTSSIAITNSGNYSVVVKNSSNCSTTSSVYAVTANAQPTASISPGGTPVICAGGSLTASGAATYQWQLNGTNISGATSSSLIVPQSGSYSVVPTSAAGCPGAQSAVVQVTLKSYPSATITPSGPATFCSGGTLTLSAPAGADSYAWYRDGSLVGTAAQVNATIGGGYQLIATNGTSCSTNSNVLTVTVNSPPQVPTVTASGSTTICTGGLLTLSASSGPYFQWKQNGTDIAGATGSSYAPTATGSYSVVAISVQGCVSNASNAIAVTVNPFPSSSITAVGSTTFCSGGSVSLNASGGDSYAWYRDGGLVGTGSQITATQGGAYTVITTKTGCATTSAVTPVTVNSLPGASVAPASVSFCSGQTRTLTASPAGMSYQWFVNGVALTNETAQTVVTAIPGNFQVRITNSNGCASMSSGTPVSVFSLPIAKIATRYSCGRAILTSIVKAAGYQWSNGSSDSTISVSALGSYSLQIRDNNGCWSNTATVTITTIPATSFLSIGQSNPLCPTGVVNLTPSFKNGNALSYSWSNGDTAPTTTVYTSGTFSCTITFEGGCSLTRSTNVVRQNPCMMLSTAAPELEPQQIDELIVSTTLFPNPASTEVMVVTPPMNVVRKVTLFSMQGIAVQNDVLPSGASRHTIKLPLVAEGMYLLKLDGLSGVEVHKVMIRRE